MSFGSFNNEDDNVVSEINVTPLVDVMLVLLIVFMITMPILTHSINLELPTASVKTDVQPKAPLRIAIDSEGHYVFGEDSTNFINEDELREKLEKAFKENADTVIAIAADKAADYGYVAIILAMAREVGLTKVGFVIEPK